MLQSCKKYNIVFATVLPTQIIQLSPELFICVWRNLPPQQHHATRSVTIYGILCASDLHQERNIEMWNDNIACTRQTATFALSLRRNSKRAMQFPVHTTHVVFFTKVSKSIATVSRHDKCLQMQGVSRVRKEGNIEMVKFPLTFATKQSFLIVLRDINILLHPNKLRNSITWR